MLKAEKNYSCSLGAINSINYSFGVPRVQKLVPFKFFNFQDPTIPTNPSTVARTLPVYGREPIAQYFSKGPKSLSKTFTARDFLLNK